MDNSRRWWTSAKDVSSRSRNQSRRCRNKIAEPVYFNCFGIVIIIIIIYSPGDTVPPKLNPLHVPQLSITSNKHVLLNMAVAIQREKEGPSSHNSDDNKRQSKNPISDTPICDAWRKSFLSVSATAAAAQASISFVVIGGCVGGGTGTLPRKLSIV